MSTLDGARPSQQQRDAASLQPAYATSSTSSSGDGARDRARVWASLRQQLESAEKLGDATRIVQDVRERIDVVQTPEYGSFLQCIFPALRDLVRYKSREQLEDNAENRIRHGILEIFVKFPTTEPLRPFVSDLMVLALRIVELDNEDNACIALKIILDLHKVYRPNLESYVQPFLDLVMKMYENMQLTSRTVWHAPPDGEGGGGGGGGGAAHAPTHLHTHTHAHTHTPLLRCMESFKALEQCPVIVMLLFQTYAKFATKCMPKMLPLMIGTLNLSAGGSTAAGGVAGAAPRQRQRHREFVAAQVKTLQFVLYILRINSDNLKPYEKQIVDGVMTLLRSCPHEQSSSARKDLLNSVRHILASDLRRGFVHHLDDLLEESTLCGPASAIASSSSNIGSSGNSSSSSGSSSSSSSGSGSDSS